MGEPARRIATYADIEVLPPNLVGEIIDGALHTMSRPAPKNAFSQMRLTRWSDVCFSNDDGGPGGWWILPEPELHLGNDVLVPNVAGWRKSRLPELPDGAYFTIAPDWICEVLSPSTAGYDRVKKMNSYARHGIAHAWMLNPLERVLEAYELREQQWVRVIACAENDRACVPPFEQVELDLSLLWATKSA